MVDTHGIVCPYCKKISKGKVIDTRRTDYGKRRRRICEHCDMRFTTVEFSIKSRGDLYGLLLAECEGKKEENNENQQT